MDVLAISLLNGISWGMILFLIACGFSLIYGVMGILNLAHGTLYVLGAFVGLTVVKYWGNFGLALVIGGLGAVLLGIILERVFLSRLYKQINEQVLLTLGFVYICTNVYLWIWGPHAKMGTAPAMVSGSVSIGDLSFPIYRFVIIIVGVAMFVGLWWWQDRTRVGAIMRAGMDDKEMTMGLGINYKLLASAIFLLGSFMGGFAGFLGAPILGVQFAMSFDILLLACIVVIIGGVGSVQGALLGAVLLGCIDSFGKTFFPDLAMFTMYLAFIIALMVKPTGILGEQAS